MFFIKNKFLLILILVVGLGILSSVYVYLGVRESQLEKFTQRAVTLSLAFNESDISNLKGNLEDLNSPEYLKLKEKLIKIKSENEDITFIYLMNKIDNDYVFLVDSENEDSEDYSPPGQKYEDEADDLNYVFKNKRSISTFISDSWGSWISSSAPILENDEIIAILGIDVDKKLYNQTLLVYTLIPITLTIILTIIIISLLLISRAQKESLEVRSNFVSIAAHDLRSPITAIKWICEIILKPDVKISEDEKMNYIKDIDKNTHILLTFIEELLDATTIREKKNRKLTKEIVEINSLIDQSLIPLELSMKEKKIELIKSISKFDVNIDKDKMRRVFSNIISNSIKYSPDNSKIEIDFERYKNNLIIYVKDQGIGIPKSEQNKILNGYYRAKNAKEFTQHGTGLGLFYCSNIIKLHKGEMRIESEENRGTTIAIEIPMS